MRAQAAIEYLTTYGWAIIVLIIMLGALSYFGVINPKNWAPDRCDMGTEFTCKDHAFILQDEGGPNENLSLKLFLVNNLQERITITQITCQFESTAPLSYVLSKSVGSQDEMELTCDTTDASVIGTQGKIRATYTIEYTKKDKPFSHEVDGTAFSNIVR